jgi:hypothetical protein
LYWLRSSVGQIENGFTTSGGWGTKVWVTNNHAMPGLESLDLVGSGLEAVIDVSIIRLS